MKKIIVIFLLLFLAGCSGGVDIPSNAGMVEGVTSEVSTKEKTIQEIIDNGDENAVILDVRSKDERDVEYVLGSLHLDVEDIKLGEIPEASKDAKIYVYCRSGNRAGQAISILEKKGFENLVNIGGLVDWKNLGGETNLNCEGC